MKLICLIDQPMEKDYEDEEDENTDHHDHHKDEAAILVSVSTVL